MPRAAPQNDVDGRLGITKKAHKKKLWNAIKKLKYAQADKEAKKAEKKGGKKVREGPWYHTHIDHPSDISRRDRLRRHHNVDAAARLLQRKFRRRYARARIKQFHEIIRVQRAKDDAERARVEGQNWWPSRVRGAYTGLDPGLKVSHGKRRVALGVKGWGHYEGAEFVPGPEGLTDAHVSRWYTARLNRDETEMKFTGGDITDAMNAVDASMDHIAFGGGGKKASSKRFN